VRVAVLGDICLDAELDAWLGARVPELHQALRADVVVANFESVIDGSRAGEPAEGKIHLSTPLQALGKLKAIGVDYLSVANNHIMDYGEDAAAETIAKLEDVFGSGRVFGWNGRPGVQLAPGLEVLGVCFPEANPRGTDGPVGPVVTDEIDEILALRASPSTLIYAHWGEEQLTLASPSQRRRAREFVDGGAAHVVGSHSHVIGPGESLGGRPVGEGGPTVLYGLGNFLFPAMPKGSARVLGSNTRSAAALYEWNGSMLRYVGWHHCSFRPGFDVSVRRGRTLFPGSPVARLHLALGDAAGESIYRWTLSTRGLRLGMVKVLTGVEAPSVGKLRTALRLIRGGTASTGRSERCM